MAVPSDWEKHWLASGNPDAIDLISFVKVAASEARFPDYAITASLPSIAEWYTGVRRERCSRTKRRMTRAEDLGMVERVREIPMTDGSGGHVWERKLAKGGSSGGVESDPQVKTPKGKPKKTPVENDLADSPNGSSAPIQARSSLGSSLDKQAREKRDAALRAKAVAKADYIREHNLSFAVRDCGHCGWSFDGQEITHTPCEDHSERAEMDW